MSIIAGVPRWPNLFIVGAPKGGTTTLWRYLDQHPDVFMSPEKEPNFFLDPTPPVQGADRGRISRPLRRRERTRRGSARRAGGTSRITTTPGLIKARVPDARIMIAPARPGRAGVLLVLARREVRDREPPLRGSGRRATRRLAVPGRRRSGQEARLPRLLLAARGAVPRRVRRCHSRRLSRGSPRRSSRQRQLRSSISSASIPTLRGRSRPAPTTSSRSRATAWLRG